MRDKTDLCREDTIKQAEPTVIDLMVPATVIQYGGSSCRSFSTVKCGGRMC